MALSANIVATIKLDSDTYTVNLNIPSAQPTKDAPYEFSVQNAPASGTATTLLDLKVADQTHYHFQLTPPTSILSTTGVVESLSLQVDDNYNESTGKFDN